MDNKIDAGLIAAVRYGTVPWEDVGPDVRAAVNAQISAEIQERLRETNWAEELHRLGQPVVGLDADGHIRQYFPDGSSKIVRHSPY